MNTLKKRQKTYATLECGNTQTYTQRTWAGCSPLAVLLQYAHHRWRNSGCIRTSGTCNDRSSPFARCIIDDVRERPNHHSHRSQSRDRAAEGDGRAEKPGPSAMRVDKRLSCGRQCHSVDGASLLQSREKVRLHCFLYIP